MGMIYIQYKMMYLDVYQTRCIILLIEYYNNNNEDDKGVLTYTIF
jgi:hypothetical protein